MCTTKGANPIDDRFMRGVLSGVLSGLAGIVFSLLLVLLGVEPEIDLYDLAGIFAVGYLPVTPWERGLGLFIDLVVSGMLGVGFAFLLLVIGTRYLVFKGWFYAISLWYMFYPLFLMILSEKVPRMDPLSSMVNALSAGVFGIVMALSYSWLSPKEASSSANS